MHRVSGDAGRLHAHPSSSRLRRLRIPLHHSLEDPEISAKNRQSQNARAEGTVSDEQERIRDGDDRKGLLLQRRQRGGSAAIEKLFAGRVSERERDTCARRK